MALAEACRRVAELHVRRGNPGALRPRIMTFSELNSRPGDSPSSPGIAPPRDFKVINVDWPRLAHTAVRAVSLDRKTGRTRPR
jgi:hypothetical protein